MKKFALFLTAVLVVLLTVNCKKGTNANNSSDAGKEAVDNTEQVQEPMVLGKLNFVNLKEGEQPVMTGLSLNGNLCGTSVFELNEWIEFHPQANDTEIIKVMVFKHNEDQGFYLNNTLNDETPGYVQAYDLSQNPDADEADHWGSFYLNPDDVEPGLYDFVFLHNDKVFATMLTKFFKECELSNKSDQELEALMK